MIAIINYFTNLYCVFIVQSSKIRDTDERNVLLK